MRDDAGSVHVPEGDAIRPPFFVVGADRSGTTLLRLYLNAHPHLAIPSESWFLIDLFRAFPDPMPLAPDDVERTIAIVTGHRRYRDGWHVPAAALRERLRAAAPPTPATFVDTLFRLEVGAAKSVRWGDKTPEYVSHVAAIEQHFPRAQFVHIVRDGRDVFLSLSQRRWKDRGWSPFEIGRYWSAAVKDAAAAEARLGPERFLRVRYEDLVLDTEATLEGVCAFLGVPFEPVMLAAHQHAEEIQTASERAQRVHDKLGRAPRDSDVARWRREGPPWARALAVAHMALLLRAYGYPDVPPAWRAALLRPVSAAHFAWTRRAVPFARRVQQGVRRRLARRT